MGVACLLLLVIAAWAAENSLFPALDGTEQYTGGNVVIDASHKDQGYFMDAYTGGGSKRLKLRTTKDGKTYTFDLNGEGEYEVFPLQMGDGAYQIEVFRQVKGNSYSSEFSQRIDVALQQENLPFLYPNQYVWYEPEGDIVALSDQLCGALETDAEKVAAVEDYIAQNMTYDYDKARTVQSGYLPDVEEIIDSNTGAVKAPGEEGELVVTTLTKEGIPLLRYRTKDITRLNYEKCECGRTHVRMDKPLGRTDDMLKIKGVNVFPTQIESVLVSIPEVGPQYQIVLGQKNYMDTFEINIEVSDGRMLEKYSELENLQNKVCHKLQTVLGLDAKINLVEPRSLERFVGKAKRVIDNRKK